MLKQRESLFMRMERSDKAEVRAAIKMWAVRKLKREKSTQRVFEAEGWVEVEAQEGTLVLPDGRPVVWVRDKALALPIDLHKQRIAELTALAAQHGGTVVVNEQRSGETKSVAGTDELSKMTCPKCGDTLQYSTVCPSCAAGSAGYRHRYACVRGCVDFVSKDKI